MALMSAFHYNFFLKRFSQFPHKYKPRENFRWRQFQIDFTKLLESKLYGLRAYSLTVAWLQSHISI